MLQTDWVNGGRLDVLVDGIKAKTDKIPDVPASVGSKMDIVDNPSTTGKAALANANATRCGMKSPQRIQTLDRRAHCCLWCIASWAGNSRS